MPGKSLRRLDRIMRFVYGIRLQEKQRASSEVMRRAFCQSHSLLTERFSHRVAWIRLFAFGTPPRQRNFGELKGIGMMLMPYVFQGTVILSRPLVSTDLFVSG